MSKKAPYWGNTLQDEMNKRDWAVSDLARELGVSRAAVYQWLSKPYPTLSADKAAQLQALFNMPYYKIFPLVTEDD